MKRSLILVFFLSAFFFTSGQNNEFELQVTFKPFAGQYIYLGYHYGKQKPIIDSIKLDSNSSGVFKASKKKEKGVYLIGFPEKAGYFEILIDKEQKFSVFADANDIPGSVKFEGSPDNDLFLDYQRFSSGKGKAIDSARSQFAFSKNATDSSKIYEYIRKCSNDIFDFRHNMIQNSPNATISSLLNAMKDPVIPPADQHPGGKYDSMYVYQFYKNHYWDGANFYDEKLVRTTFFEDKLDQYFEQLVFPDPDSVIKEIDWMLGYASINAEMQRFLLVKFINRYINPKFMWDDRVFVFLFEKYFSDKTYPWLNEQSKKTIFDRAYSMMANLFGTQASDIDLPDSTGKSKTLFSVTEPYTLVVFWDPTCGHCKETMPRIDSIYKAKWKAGGVKIFAISKETDGTQKDWKEFLDAHQFNEWINVYYSKEADKARITNQIPSYFQLYDVQTVPTLYLLDKDKRILAKKIPFEQIDEVLTYKFKGQ